MSGEGSLGEGTGAGEVTRATRTAEWTTAEDADESKCHRVHVQGWGQRLHVKLHPAPQLLNSHRQQRPTPPLTPLAIEQVAQAIQRPTADLAPEADRVAQELPQTLPPAEIHRPEALLTLPTGQLPKLPENPEEGLIEPVIEVEGPDRGVGSQGQPDQADEDVERGAEETGREAASVLIVQQILAAAHLEALTQTTLALGIDRDVQEEQRRVEPFAAVEHGDGQLQ